MSRPRLRIVKPGDYTEEFVPEAGECLLIRSDEHQGPDDRFRSKFSGLPFWPEQSEWPLCSGCGKPLTFVFQLHGGDVPGRFPGLPHMLSLFYCFSCNPWWDVDGKGFFLGLLPLGDLPLLPAKKTPMKPILPTRTVRLVPEEDFPHILDRSGSEGLTPDERELLSRKFPVRTSSKVGGWPAWENAPDFPACRFCGGETAFWGQISSGEPHGFVFGQNGRLFLFRCRRACRKEAFSISVQSE